MTDIGHKGSVVRGNGVRQEIYAGGHWKPTGILLEYFSDESPLYEYYKQITESEALNAIRTKSA